MDRNIIEVLINFLGFALSENKLELKSEGFDWIRIISLSYEQEVNCIVADGINKAISQHSMPSKALEYFNLEKQKCDKVKWIVRVLSQEKRYSEQLKSAQKLSALYADNEMITYVLKGFSLSQLYPIPSHRFSCDLDCFLLPQKGEFDAYDFGNSLVAAKGVKVDTSYYKHSVFAYKGLTVENHRYCCSVKRSRRTQQLESYLQSLLKNYTPDYIKGTCLALPPQLFQALFMIEHANGHFLYSKMNLKQVCDWAMMRKAFHNTLDWAEFDRQCQRFGLTNFVVCMNHLADYILGRSTYADLRAIDKQVFDDIFKPIRLSPNPMKQRIEKAWGVLCSSWKFKNFCADSMLKELSHSVWAYLREDNPELD